MAYNTPKMVEISEHGPTVKKMGLWVVYDWTARDNEMKRWLLAMGIDWCGE